MFMLIQNERDPDMFDVCTPKAEGEVDVWGCVHSDFIQNAGIADYKLIRDRPEKWRGGFPPKISVPIHVEEVVT